MDPRFRGDGENKMTNIFGNLAADLAATSRNAMLGGQPGASAVMPGAGAGTSRNKPGLFGLGGPGVGLIDKFNQMAGGMFGGNPNPGAATKPIPGYQEGGEVGDKDLEAQYQTLIKLAASTTDPVAKEQIGNTMWMIQEIMMKAHQQRMNIAKENPNANVLPEGSQPGTEGQAAPGKKRKIIIEESPSQ